MKKVLTGIKGNQTFCHPWRKASPSWDKKERHPAGGGPVGDGKDLSQGPYLGKLEGTRGTKQSTSFFPDTLSHAKDIHSIVGASLPESVNQPTCTVGISSNRLGGILNSCLCLNRRTHLYVFYFLSKHIENNPVFYAH